VIQKDSFKIQIELSEITIDIINIKFGQIQKLLSIIYICTYAKTLNNILISLGDHSSLKINDPTVTFCSNKSHDILVPDSNYIMHKGYIHELKKLENLPKVLSCIAYFVGGILGLQKDRGLLVKFSLLNSDILKVNIAITQKTKIFCKKWTPEISTLCTNNNLYIKRIELIKMYDYLIQIDVDGVCNAWSGFFHKLYSGRPLLKIQSSLGFKQWYYDRLKANYHYFDLKSDLSNFREKYNEALEQSKTTKVFPGREFISKMNYDDELQLAANKISFYFK
jgi:hypothetical protein